MSLGGPPARGGRPRVQSLLMKHNAGHWHCENFAKLDGHGESLLLRVNDRVGRGAGAAGARGAEKERPRRGRGAEQKGRRL